MGSKHSGQSKISDLSRGAGKKIALGVQSTEFFAIKFLGNKITTKGVSSSKNHTP